MFGRHLGDISKRLAAEGDNVSHLFPTASLALSLSLPPFALHFVDAIIVTGNGQRVVTARVALGPCSSHMWLT